MIDSSFAAAYIDGGVRHKVLGRVLRPFSLWHLFLLQAIHSPLTAGGNATLFDLKNAVSICRLKYRNCTIDRQWFPARVGIKRLKSEIDSFMEYVGDYLSKPEYCIVPLDIKETTPPRRLTHPPAVICTAYNAAYGASIPVREAWDMPIGEAYISEAMHLREQGSQLDFLDDEEKEFQRQMKEAGIG